MSKSVLHSIKLLTSISPLILEYLVDMGCETNFVMYYFLFISFKIYSLLLSFFSIFLSFYSRIFRNTSLFTLFLKLRLKCIQSMRLRVKRQAGLALSLICLLYKSSKIISFYNKLRDFKLTKRQF